MHVCKRLQVQVNDSAHGHPKSVSCKVISHHERLNMVALKVIDPPHSVESTHCLAVSVAGR